MRHFFWTLLLLGLTDCAYNYMSAHEQKRFRKNKQTFHTVNQTKQIREKDHFFVKDSTHTIYIQEVITKKKNDPGIYAYNFLSTHFGRVNFFLYKDSTVSFLDRTHLDSLQKSAQLFLINNDFSEREIKVAKTRIEKVWNINSTDSF